MICTSSAGDHSALCDGSAPCPVLIDRIIECDQDFGALDVPILATAQDVIATGAQGSDLVSAWSVTADEVVTLTELPEDRVYGSLRMAVDDTGAPTLAAFSRPLGSPFDTPGKLLLLQRQGDEWIVGQPPAQGRPDALAIDAQGVHHMVLPTGQSGYQLFTGTLDGNWQSQPAPLPVDSYKHHVAIAADNTPLGYGFLEQPTSHYQLYVMHDGQAKQLGHEIGPALFPDDYVPFGGPAPTEPNAFPLYGAVFSNDAGLRVSWAGNSGWGETPVPNTGKPTSICPEWGGPPPCPADCQDMGSGLEHEVFAVARGSDNTLWLSYLITHVDRTVSYPVQSINGQRLCSYEIGQNDSTFDLVVTRVSLDGTPPTVVMTMPVDGLKPSQVNYSTNVIAAHAYNGDLAIWLRAPHSDPTLTAARILRIDTSLLQP